MYARHSKKAGTCFTSYYTKLLKFLLAGWPWVNKVVVVRHMLLLLLLLRSRSSVGDSYDLSICCFHF